MSTTWYPQGPKIPVVTGSGPYLVRWLDYKGNILKSQYATSGQTLSNPTPPVFSGLTWYGWSGSAANIQSDIDIVGVWTPTDGKAHIFVEASALAGLTPTIKVNKSDTSTLLVEWGDGTTSTTTASGNVAITKPDPYAAGNYEIKKSISVGAGTFTGGYGTSLNEMVSGVAVTEIWFRAITNSISAYACNGAAFRTTTAITGGSGVISIGDRAFSGLYRVAVLAFPEATTIAATGVFDVSAILMAISLPKAGVIGVYGGAIISAYNFPKSTSVPAYAFYTNPRIRSILLGPGTISIGTSAFEGVSSLKILIVGANTPPALASVSSLSGFDPRLLIYVPAASVASYQAATNWSAFASRIVGY